MRKPRVGIVGLGNISQKAYLPILTKEENWSLIGAYTPNPIKRKDICRKYRIEEYHSLDNLSDKCDVIFVHSSVSSHYEVVSYVLAKGKDVYVDKPLAATVEEAERLVELSCKLKRKLMVGFNRRFAPMYVKAKELCHDIAWIRIDKYRKDKVNSSNYKETILDAYIHLIDTARWISDDGIRLTNGRIQQNETNNLIYAHHSFQTEAGKQIFTGFHRKSGTGLELLEIVGTDKIVRVKDLHTFEVEENGEIKTSVSNSWDSILKEKGFEDAIDHFIFSLLGDTNPICDGIEGLKSQQLMQDILDQEE